MNSQQPTHSGMPQGGGYGGMLQQQAAMLQQQQQQQQHQQQQQQQYGRIVVQQGQQQQQVPVQQQQIMGQQLYNQAQAFYPQAYMNVPPQQPQVQHQQQPNLQTAMMQQQMLSAAQQQIQQRQQQRTPIAPMPTASQNQFYTPQQQFQHGMMGSVQQAPSQPLQQHRPQPTTPQMHYNLAPQPGIYQQQQLPQSQPQHVIQQTREPQRITTPQTPQMHRQPQPQVQQQQSVVFQQQRQQQQQQQQQVMPGYYTDQAQPTSSTAATVVDYQQQFDHQQHQYHLQQLQQQQQLAAQQQMAQQQLQKQVKQQGLQTHKSPLKENENSVVHNEMIRKQRLESERQKEMERDKREKDRIQEELQKKEKQATVYAENVKNRLDQIPYPVSLAACHSTTKLTKLLPVPQEYLKNSPSLAVFDTSAAVAQLHSPIDGELIEYMSNLLLQSFDDVRAVKTKYSDMEQNIYDGEPLPPLIRAIHETNQYALHIQSEFDDMTLNLDPDLAMAIAEVAAQDVGDLLTLDDVNIDNLPSTSSAIPSHQASSSQHQMQHEPQHQPPPQRELLPTNSSDSEKQNDAFRRQMVSLGKTPKGSGPPKRKRDEVDDLVDSLTPYYGVSGGRRERRRRTDGGRGGSVSDDENTPVNTDVEDQQILHRPIDEPKFFTKSRKQKKHRQDADDVSDLVMSSSDRPPTPTEVINQREFEWNERQRERQDKIKKRQMHFEQQGFSHDAVAESESQMRVESFMEQVFDSLGGYNALVNARDSSILKDALIDRPLLEQFRFEIQKLKIWKKLHKIDVERLSRFVQILERNIRDVIDEEGFLMCKELLENDDVAMETARDLIHQRLIRAAEAASIALHIMTAHKIPKQVLVEDTIERATQLCKQLLSVVIYPAADSIVRHAKNAGRSKADDAAARRSRRRGDLFTSWVQVIYVRCVEMIECFAELVRFHHINEFVVVQLSTMATAPFFVDGIGEIQTMAIQLLSVVFHHDESLRAGIIQELLFSIHQIPPAKNVKNCYRLSNTESIHNFTVLLLQLIQSVVVMPRHKKNEEGEEEHATEEDDHVIEECFSSAKKYAATFLRGFLHKCTAKAEEDYRRKFEQFLHDLLLALNRPEWPAAELLLTVLGNLLVQSFKNTKLEISLRTASLDYLGTITARLRRDHIIAQREANSQFENVRFDMVVRGILYEEANDPTKLLDDIDTTSLSSMEKFQKLQQALVDYLIATKGNDASIEHCIAFYACEWYKGIIDDIGMARRRYVELTASMDPASRDFKKEDKRYKRSNERADVMKDFLIRLSDKKVIKRRINYIAKTGNYMIDSDALWTVKYLASKREFSQSFDIYLRHIIHGVSSENSVGIRTKAMRCLTQIIEADSEVLAMAEVHEAVNFRMMDPNVAVREATIELLGKYLVSRPDLFESYYNILKDRIKDTGVAVRKRIIRILRDYVDKAFDTAPQVPEILALIMRRVTDEEGVRKLTLDALTGIWFVPVANNDIRIINKKVDVLIETVSHCLKDNRADFVEAFLTTVLKKEDIDRSITRSAQQLVSALIEFVLTLDAKLANGAEGMNDSGGAELTSDQKVEREKKHQETLLASLTTLSIMSKVKPELLTLHTNVFLPYLSMNVQTSIEVQVLNLVINMLERTIPLIDHPSDTLFKTMDIKLCHIVNKMGMLLIQSAIACLGVVCKKWPRQKSGIADTFLRYVGILNEVKNSIPDVSTPIPNSRRPTLMRCLYSIGAMCRHFDFDIILSEDGEVQSPPPQQQQTPSKFKFDSKREIGVYADTVYTILIFFSRSIDDGVNKIAVGSLGQMCAEYTDFFQRRDLRNMYQSLLGSDDPKHLKRKIEVLSNLNLFLVAEEERMIKASEEYRKMREQGDIDDDIRNADTRSDTNSAVIQVFWKYVLSAYLHVDQEVRIASANVVYQTMRQGLVTPGDVLPTMIAMTTDPLSSIRVKIESLLRDIDQKYSGMLSSKATKGIRWSFEVQRRIFRKTNAPGTVLRGFRASEHCGPNALDPQGLPKHSNEAVAMLHSLYVCLRTNRQQRRSFINSVVRMISEECPFGDSLTLEEMLFIVDNLATFPYQMMDEALFLIHTCDSIISITGQNVLFSFKGMLVPKRPGELLDEEEEFMPENLYRRLPDDKTQIYELVKHSQACFLLLYLKTYIKKLYRLTDAKVSEYSPSEAAKIYEKPMIRQQISIFRPDLTLQEFRPEVIAQRNTVEGHITLCEQMAYFRTMFYSLDLHDEGDDDEGEDEAASGEHSSSGGGGPAAKKRKVTTADDDDGEGGATTDDNGE